MLWGAAPIRRAIGGFNRRFQMLVSLTVATIVAIGLLAALAAALPAPSSIPMANPMLMTTGYGSPRTHSADSAREREIETRAQEILADLRSAPAEASLPGR